MSKINLEEEDLKTLFDAVNEGYEPPADLIGKLFPSFFEKLKQDSKFDFQELARQKIPTIEYSGKRQEGVILASASLLGQSAPLQVVRTFGEHSEDGWRNMIVQGDNLQFLKTVFLNQDPLIKDKVKGKVKLFYNDPPFATKSDFQSGDGATSYSDKIESAEFLEDLRERLIFMREILADDGSIYIHCDWRLNSYIRAVMDELFGKENFRNEIIWKRTGARSGSVGYNIIHDTIFYYSVNSNDYLWNIQYTPYSEKYLDDFFRYSDSDGRSYRLTILTAPGIRNGLSGNSWRGINPTATGRHWAIPKFIRPQLSDPNTQDIQKALDELDKLGRIIWPQKEGGVPSFKQYADEMEGVELQSIWTDVSPVSAQAIEQANYPTQKPEALLERIVKASSNPGDLVMDIFGGSGTTAAVAEKLDRRWITCDFGKHAIYTMQRRLLNIAESKALGQEKSSKKYSLPPKPLAVVSVGAYNFSRVMELRKNKEAYITFVLSLFGIPQEVKDFAGKYRLDGIYAEKDGDPVEIFPVWEDDYLYHVKVDQDYLKEIIVQSRGRIKGNFYIIVPETCTVISDTTLPNNSGDVVHFKLLKFPYKILEEIARNFDIEEQPDSPSNINNLVSSVGFYFNDEVIVKAEKKERGFKLTTFKTMIVNREGKMSEGLDALSLVLIDLDYDGQVFKLDKAVYAKEINEDDLITIDGITDKTAIIAIDKHGNESKPIYITG